MEELESPAFGELLRQRRSALGWTQEDLASRAGLSVEAVGTLERGIRQRPRRATVRLLARALELDEDDRLLFEASAQRAIYGQPDDRGATAAIGSDAECETRTFIVADIRGYTRLSIEQGPAVAAKLAAKFALLTRSGVAARGGKVIDMHDDEALAMFPSPRQALIAATDLQTRFARASLADPSFPLNVGIGIEVGEAEPVEGVYRGAAISLAGRLCRLAGPGEILTTDRVLQLTRESGDFEYVHRGEAQLRGLADPLLVVEAHRTAPRTSRGTDEGQSSALDEGMRRGVRLPIGGFLGALPAGPIVGREHELKRILTALDGVTGGTGQLMLLSGEAGVGKTRLAQEVNLTVRNRGFLVAAGRCYEPQEVVPFYPFIDALALVFAASPDSIRAEAGQRWPYLGQLLLDQIGTYPVSSIGPDDQQRLFHAVTGFLQEVADWAPVALFLDDLHWADSSSLALLQHLARQTRGDRVFLLGTYRDVEIGSGHPLKAALRDLGREGMVTSVEVRRLEVDATSALIAAVLGEEAVSEEFTQLIHSRTEGNPYFVEQVVRAMVERGDIFRTDGGWDHKALAEIDVPESVRSVVGQRLSRVSGETQVVLHEASVLGQTFHFDDLEAMGSRSEQELEDALEEATLAGLARVMGGDRYMFDHALTHQTLYEDLSPRRKRNLHLAAGTALEKLPARRRKKRASELAGHFLEGADAQKALPWTMLAGNQADAVFAHGDAEMHYRRALQLADELDDRGARAEALERLGRVYRLSGRYVEAIDTLEEAASWYHDLGQLPGEARAVGQIGRVYLDEGRSEEGVRRVRPLLEHLENGEPGTDLDGVVADLSVVMAHLLSRGGAYVDSAALAAQGSARARRAGDTGLLAEAEFRRGTSLSQAGDFHEGFPVMEEAIALAEAADDPEIASRAVGNLALFHWDRGEASQARALISRSLELCRQTNDPSKIADKLSDLASVDFTQGDWESARANLESAERALRGMPSSWIETHNSIRLGQLFLVQGEIEEGLRKVEAGRDMAENDRDILAECQAACVLGEQAIFSGDPELARCHLQRFLSRYAADGGPPEGLQTWGLALFARIFAELGDIETAEAYLDRICDERVVAELDTVYSVRAVVAARKGKWDEAERYAEEALAFARGGGFIVSEARLLYFWGRWLAEKGEVDRARERMEEALAIFRRLGARPYVERIKQQLADSADERERSPAATNDL